MWHKYCYIVLSESVCPNVLTVIVYTWNEQMWAVFAKQKHHKCYLCEIESAPSEEKWLDRSQHNFNKKALLVYAVFTGNDTSSKRVVV